MLVARFLVLLFVLSGSRFVSAGTNTNASPLNYEEPRILHGSILSTDRTQTLFKFTRQSFRTGNRVDVVRDYNYPDGKLAARERVIYEGNDLISFTLEETETGGQGKVTIKRAPQNASRGDLLFEYSANGAAAGKRREALRPNVLISDMVPGFLVDNWEALMKGEAIKCRFIVIPRRETVGFKFTLEGESRTARQELIKIKMTPTSPIISALIEPVHFTIEKSGSHRVLEYAGRTTPKIKSENKWEDLDAVTVFDW